MDNMQKDLAFGMASFQGAGMAACSREMLREVSIFFVITKCAHIFLAFKNQWKKKKEWCNSERSPPG